MKAMAMKVTVMKVIKDFGLFKMAFKMALKVAPKVALLKSYIQYILCEICFRISYA